MEDANHAKIMKDDKLEHPFTIWEWMENSILGQANPVVDTVALMLVMLTALLQLMEHVLSVQLVLQLLLIDRIAYRHHVQTASLGMPMEPV